MSRQRLAAAIVAALLVLSGCSSNVDPPEPAPSRSSDTSSVPPVTSPTPTGQPTPDDDDDPPKRPRRALRLISFNALGHSHTKPGGDKCCEWDQSDVRTAGLVQALARHDPDIVGLQEMPVIQVRAFKALAGDTYAVYGRVDNQIAYRRDRFKVVRRSTVEIPYLRGNPRAMPVLRLRDRVTGQALTIINVHNPASTRVAARAYRDTAIKRELDVVRAERRAGRAVVLMGDFNAKDSAFCAVTAAGMTAANGGSNKNGVCRPPERMIIDWIFVAGIPVRNYRLDGTVRGTVSDHRMVLATLVPRRR